MEIIFSKHAKIRCTQRNIPQQWVEGLLKNIPLSNGKHEHLLSGTRLVVVYHDEDIIRQVVTLYADGKQIGKETIVKPSQYIHLVNKEKRKDQRRYKKRMLNKTKFKKH